MLRYLAIALSIICLVGATAALMNGNWAAGLAYLVVAAVSFPQGMDWFQSRFSVRVPTVARVIIGVVFLSAAGTFVAKNDPQDPQPQQVANTDTQDGAPEDANANTPDAAPATEPADIPLKTTDLELARAYDANEVAAQNKYGGKTLWVKGVVTGVELDMFDHPTIKMRGQNMFAATEASFDDSAKNSLGRLKKGDLVTMQCKAITEVLSAPMLSDCSLMDNAVR